jgi:CubicO group peptidase (beta-lactamase class C family)
MAIVVTLLFGSSVAAAVVGSTPDDAGDPAIERTRTLRPTDTDADSDADSDADGPERAEDDDAPTGSEDEGAEDEGLGVDADAHDLGDDDTAEVGAAPMPASPTEPDVAAPAADDVAGQVRSHRMALALDRWLAEHPEVGSVAVAVVAAGPGGSRWSGAATRPGAPMTLDPAAPYPILSITKTFTEALVLREVERGTIDLDAPMPAIDGVAPIPEGVTITPRMLLQHSSGLVNYMNADGYDPTAVMTPSRAVSLSLGTPLASAPGTVAAYANSNFHWLGLLVEHVTSRPFGDLVAELAGAAGLPTTALDPTDRPGWVGFASGGMRSTVPEVASWGAQLFTPGAVLSPEWHRQHVAVGALGVGLGVWPICPCTTDEDGALEYSAVGHDLADGGLLWFPAGDTVVAVRMANVPGDVGTLTAAVADALRAALIDEEPDRVA